MADQITTSLAQAKILVMEGQKGVPGTDGISPTVSFEPITVDGRTGNKMTVTDADHPGGQSINILNGKDGADGGSTITVDDALSSTSENPVQNKVVKAALDGKGTYSKPSGGIPKTDLASDVQTSLGKADTALQSHQSLAAYQTKSITDTGGYYTTDTVEGALQEIGAELAGVNTLIGSGVIT